MPQAVIVAAVSAGIEVGAGAIIGSLGVNSVLGAVVQTFAKHLIVNLLLAATNKSREPSLNAEAQQRKQAIRSSISPRRFVYGRARIGGTLAYAGSSGTQNEYIHLVVPMTHGEIDAYEDIYLNDLLSTDTRFSGLVRMNTHLGTSSQVADSDLDSETTDWTSAHRLRGIGYLYSRLKYDSTAFATGVPNHSAVIRGRKVYDPRTGLTQWSQNPALCVLDYLVGTAPTESGTEPIGIGADIATEIDLDTFIAAANVCDEEVDIASGGTHARYTCDGVVSMDSSPAAVMEQLLTSCAGALVYSGGVYRMFAGAPTASTFTITADMLRGPIKYRPFNATRESINGVRGTYIDPLNSYEAADFPAQQGATYVVEDGGEERWMDLALPYTLNGVRAQRLARQYLERARRAGEIEVQCNFSALGIAVWDCGTIDIDELQLDAGGKWRVKSWVFAEGGGIDLVLQEESDDAYTWSTYDEVTPASIPRPGLVRANEVEPPTNVEASSGSYISPEGSAVGGLLVEWTAAADAFIVGYEIQYSEHDADDWKQGPSVGIVTSASILFLTVGQSYDVRVRSSRSGGASSPWVEDTDITVQGDPTAPSAATGVAATAQVGAIKLDWINPSDSDFSAERIYRNTTNNSGTASSIVDSYGLPGQAGTYTDTVASGQTRYYWLKASDRSGNLSAFSSGVSATAS